MMKHHDRAPFYKPLAIAITSAIMLSACGGGSSGSGGSSTTTFSVTDAPVDDVEAVKVTFTRIDLKAASGAENDVSITFDEPVTIENLRDLTGNASTPILSDASIPPGDYNQLRIFVDGGFPNSTVTPEGGNETDLYIPGQQNGNSNGNPQFLRLVSGFTVAAGSKSDFTIDFVLRKGLTKPENQDYYLLRPAMRLVNNLEVGSISGSVSSTVVNHPECLLKEGNGAVYLYDEDLTTGDAMPEDYFDSELATGVRPIASAEVGQNESGEFTFTIGFVEAREAAYSVAYTCEPANDDPGTDDEIDFTEVQSTTVTAGEESTVSFTVEPEVVVEEQPAQEAESNPA